LGMDEKFRIFFCENNEKFRIGRTTGELVLANRATKDGTKIGWAGGGAPANC
jgi:hypothetical protein